METMYQRWRRNHIAVNMVQRDISPSEATVIGDLMQTLSPRLSFLILGIDMDEDRIALGDALSYSVAYFAKPNRIASLLPLKKFITPDTPCKYEDITAWNYNNLRIAKLFS